MITPGAGMAPTPVGVGPVNDYFFEPTVITGFSGTSTGSNIGASAEEGEPNIPVDDGGPYRTVWYSWTAPGGGVVTFDLCTIPPPPPPPPPLATPSSKSIGFDSKLGAYLGDRVWDLSLLAYNDDDGECGSLSRMSFDVKADTTYKIQVDGYDGSSGDFVLTWGLPAPAPSLSIAGVSAGEGDSGTTPFDFVVTMSEAAGSTVTVNWQTNDGTANQPGDYTDDSGTITLEAGETTATVTVDVVADLVRENDEAFTVLLSSPDGAELGQASASGTIVNDDAAADLSTYIDTFGGKAKVGGYLPYYVQVFNASGGDETEATVVIGIPANTTLDYLAPSQGSCEGGDEVTCSLGVIGGGQSAYVIMYVIPNRTGTYVNDVAVTGTVLDPDESNDTDIATKAVFPNAAGCTMTGTSAADTITGTDGDDVICTYEGDDVVHGGPGNDIIRAGAGRDSVFGDDGVDELLGEGGNDTISGGADPDKIDGGLGFDTVSYAFDPAGVTVHLGKGTATDGFSAVDGSIPAETITSVFAVIGSGFDDILTGSGVLNEMAGGAGDDRLMGLGSNDRLDGGEGIDYLDGGVGPSDTCTQGETYKSCERRAVGMRSSSGPALTGTHRCHCSRSVDGTAWQD